MPCHIVNQILLDVEYAVPIADLLLCVQPGGMPGAPNASPPTR